MANFFERRRSELEHSQRKMAAILQVSNTTIAGWESDEVIPSTPIATLATGYEVTESVIETELMAMRRRIESRRRRRTQSAGA